MKIVLDTNVLLQAVSARNPLRPVFEAILDEQVDLAISTEILLEYEELLFRHRSGPEAARLSYFLRRAPNIHLHEPQFRFRLIHTDPDDNKFVDCYLTACADYLVSNDRHFGGLSAAGFPAVRVVAAKAFLEILQSLDAMSKRRLTHGERLRKMIKEAEPDSTLRAELLAMQASLLKPKYEAVTELLKLLNSRSNQSTKWLIAWKLERVRDERIIRPIMRAL